MKKEKFSMAPLFSNRDLRKLIIPLIIEQILIIAVGMTDTVMVSGIGEAAVSGVSLVDTVNVLIINIFSAMATGGAVAAGHYLGQRESKKASASAWQLILFSTLLAIGVTVLFLLAHDFILDHLFGTISKEVRTCAETYLLITACSFVPLAIYNSGAALFRAMGNSKVTMIVSLIMNIINITGNVTMIYGFHFGVEGSAIPTTVARTIAAVIIFVMLFNPKREIHFTRENRFSLDWIKIKKILSVGIPSGLENSLFQLGKILLLSLVSTFGTFAIAANAVSNTIAMFNILPGIAIGYAQLSIISICVGAGDKEQVTYYTKKLLLLTNGFMMITSAIVFFGVDYILLLFRLTPETTMLASQILRYHAVMAIFLWVPSFSMPNTFRASGDVIYPMIMAILSMWVFRIGAAYILSIHFNMGLMGVWIAMTIDWAFRGSCYMIRYLRGSYARKIQKQAISDK